MINYLNPILLFLLIYSILAVIRFVGNFFIAILSTPPKKFEASLIETIIYGVFLSYIITYLISL
jgi:hypothetical protein